jgi:hypothetical protein
VVDGGWFSSAPYLGNERSHHMLTLLKAKEEMRVYLKNGVSGVVRLVGLGGRPAVTERDGEGVDHGLPAHCPPGAAGPGGVQAAGHKIQALQRGVSSTGQRNTSMTEVLRERWRAACDSGRGAA